MSFQRAGAMCVHIAGCTGGHRTRQRGGGAVPKRFGERGVEAMVRAMATIVKSAICKTTAKHRPSPSLFYFPGLASSPFHNPQQFPWVQILEANVQTIRQEYLALRERKVASDYSEDGEHSLHQGNWDWHSYLLKGRIQEAFRHHCPETSRILQELESWGFLMTDTPFSFCFFSTLHRGAQIAAHTGPCNLRLRCHLPLIVPPDTTKGGGGEDHYKSMDDVKESMGCGLRLGDEVRAWEEGKCIVFDDAYEHEVWNLTASERVLLLLDFWHPELVQEERQAIKDMFATVRRPGGSTGTGATDSSARSQ